MRGIVVLYALKNKLTGRVIMPAAYKLLGDRRMALLDELLARDAWTPRQVREHQAERLTSLFRCAQEHNPFWREKFEQHRLNPNGSDPFTEIAKLPILTKDEIRANWKRMRSTHLSNSEVVHETSSGSTGMQINFYQSKFYRQLHAAMEYRSRAWMGVHPGEPYLSVQAHGAHLSSKTHFWRWLRKSVERGIILDAFHIDPAKTKERLRRAARRRPTHIHGYSTSVVTIAKLADELKLDWSSLKAVSTTSEQLLDEHREELGRIFGVPVYDRYGSREVLSVSMQCDRGSHHIYSDVNYVEFAPLPDADEGMHAIIVTPLDNEAMPLFRYRGGDSASAVEGTCACGRTLPLMTGCKGRICNNFVTPDGRIINGTYFLYYFYYQEGFRSYQFHQTSANHIDLYVVPDGQLSQERRSYLEASCRKIRNDYDSQFDVDLHIVDDIPKRPGGKHLYTISDVLKHV